MIVSALYPPHIGGVERYVKNLSCELVRKGHCVTVVTSALEGNAGFFMEENIHIFRLPCFPFLNGRFPVVRKDKMYRLLVKQICTEEYDLCMVNTRFYPLSLEGVKIAKTKKISSFVLDHGSAHLSFGNAFLDFAENIYEHLITFLVKRYCHNFYGISEDSTEFLKHFGISAKGILHNAINPAEIEKIVKNCNIDFRSEHGISSDAFLICYAGRLIHRKGILELNQAVKSLAEEHPNLYLVYAGDGELRNALENVKSSNTILLGALSHDQALKLISQSDIFILPSETEGFPTTVLEAAACKTYIITTTAGGSKELIKESGMGTIIQDNSPESIQNAILDVMLNQNTQLQAIEKCYEELSRNFTWEKLADKIVLLID